MFRIKQLTIERIIILLFSILPVIDSVNGILITHGLPSIAILYKVLTLGVLLVFTLRCGAIEKHLIASSLFAIMYVVISIIVNTACLSGKLINAEYPVKLIFNILTLVFLLNLVKTNYLSCESIYRILNINTWLMIVMILVPYCLGLGSRIYSGGTGYKGFFYSNNELSAALIILFYFSLYRLAHKLSPQRIVQLGAIFVCVLLLNTKSGMATCLLGCVVFVVEYLLRRDTKRKLLLVAAILVGLFVMKDFILRQVQSFMNRQTFLYNLYGGSMLDTLVSGRTFFLESAWIALREGPAPVLRVLLGNGFCSDVLVEMDFIDIFFYLGAVGVAAVLIVFVYFFFAGMRNFKKDRTKTLAFGYLMIMAFSFLAGHILFMATSGCYFILYLCLCLTYTDKKQAPQKAQEEPIPELQ